MFSFSCVSAGTVQACLWMVMAKREVAAAMVPPTEVNNLKACWGCSIYCIMVKLPYLMKSVLP